MFIDNNSIHQYGAYLICVHYYGVHSILLVSTNPLTKPPPAVQRGRGEIRDLPGFHIPTLRPSLAVHRAPHLLHVQKICWFLMGARFFTGQLRVGLEEFFLIKHVVFLQLIQMSQHIPIHIYTYLYHGIFSRYKYRYLQV